jgi:vitamin B12/bleomycin/antimicrobial peptide transport system ATP-binding/permease protein
VLTWRSRCCGCPSDSLLLFPVLVVSSRCFDGAIQVGILMQISNAFWQVNEALSSFIGNYTTFAIWRTTVISIGHRRSLEAYHQRLIMVEKESGHPGLIRVESPIDPSRRPK